jgi:hypothetical protein
MYCPICQLPIARRIRAKLRRLLALGLAALGACDGGDDLLAPSEAPPVASTASVEPDLAITAGTSQRIVFTTTRNGGYDVYKMESTGKQHRTARE